jgi:hypothetical protein
LRKATLAIGYATLLVALAATARAGSPVLFLDRCAAGCNYTPGFDDSRTNTSSLPSGSSTLSAFAHGDASFDAIVACVRDTFAPFAIEVTDVDPGGADHFEVAVAGTPQQLGLLVGVLNVSPTTCQNDGVIANGLAFAFANTLGDVPLEICWNAAQAAGALLGLDHEILAGDVMTYLAGSLPKTFLDETAPCGEFQARDCLCGGTTQNSHQRLLATLPEPGAAAGSIVALVALAVRARLARLRPR